MCSANFHLLQHRNSFSSEFNDISTEFLKRFYHEQTSSSHAIVLMQFFYFAYLSIALVDKVGEICSAV